MGYLAGLLIIAVIIGALLGGESFGETIRLGCGCLVLLVVAAVIYFRYSH
jgi:hypothetical protein